MWDPVFWLRGWLAGATHSIRNTNDSEGSRGGDAGELQQM